MHVGVLRVLQGEFRTEMLYLISLEGCEGNGKCAMIEIRTIQSRQDTFGKSDDVDICRLRGV